MNLLTNQEKNFVSIYRREVVDLTEVLTATEKGIVVAIGKLSIGNPYYPQILTRTTEPYF